MSISSRINEMSSHIEQAYDELQGLGADLTNVNKNIENISMVLDDIYDSMPQVSGEGTSLTLDDTRVGKIKSTLKGNTSQDGTPTPNSPIPVNVVSGDNEINVVGKNLLDSKNLSSATYSGISFTPVYENGLLQYINVNGTATNDASYSAISSGKTPYANRTPIISNVTHYCSGCPSNGSTSTYSISYYYYNDTNTYLGGVTDTGNGATINNANAYYVASYITIKSGTTMNNVKFYPMVSTLSDNVYDPYNADIYNVDLPVENLFDLSNPQSLSSADITATYDTTKNEIILNGTSSGIAYIAFNINTIANGSVISFGGKVDTPNSNIKIQPANGGNSVGSACTFSSKLSKLENETLSNSINRVYIIVSSGVTLNNYVIKPSLMLGSKLKGFTSYGTTPIELCKIGNYQDYFYKDSGKWYLHKEIGKVVLNGTQSINLQSINSYNIANFIITFARDYYDTSKFFNMLSNRFTKQTTSIASTQTEGFSPSLNSIDHILGVFLRINSSTASTTTAMNTWLSNNNTLLYYIEETPIVTEITYQPLIDQLNLLEKAISYEGQTNILQVNNDLPFIISASALKEWQESTSLNNTLSMVNPLSLENTLNTQENDTQPIEVDNIEPLEEEENEES